MSCVLFLCACPCASCRLGAYIYMSTIVLYHFSLAHTTTAHTEHNSSPPHTPTPPVRTRRISELYAEVAVRLEGRDEHIEEPEREEEEGERPAHFPAELRAEARAPEGERAKAHNRAPIMCILTSYIYRYKRRASRGTRPRTYHVHLNFIYIHV